MNTHRAYMKRLGISDGQAEAVRMSLANRAYTNYMLSVGYSGGVPEVLAAILACSWSYAEIGERLAAVPGAAEHPFYGEWITGYAGEEYQATNRALIGRMDTAAAGLAPRGSMRSNRFSSIAAVLRGSSGRCRGRWPNDA